MKWKTVKLGEVLRVRRERVKIEPDWDYKLVTIRIRHNGLALRSIVKGVTIGSSMSRIHAGDFLMSGIDARHGAFGIVPEELDGAIITNDFWCMDVNQELIDKEYLFYLTTTDFFDQICKECSIGVTNRVRLQKSLFFQRVINVPPVEEQRLIANQIKTTKATFASLSSEFTHQLSLVKQLRQQLLKEALMGKLSIEPPMEGEEILAKQYGKLWEASGSELLAHIRAEKAMMVKEKKIKADKPQPTITVEETPFELPEGWIWCRLAEVAIQVVDCPHSTPKYVYEDTGYYAIDTTCIDNSNRIVKLRNLSQQEYEDRIKRLVPSENDIVYTREGSIGFAVLIPKGRKICLGQRVMLFRPASVINPKFMQHVIMDETFKKRILEKHRGIGAKHVNVKDVILSLIPLPPIRMQHKIMEQFAHHQALCASLEMQIQETLDLNAALLQEVLREKLGGSAANRTNVKRSGQSKDERSKLRNSNRANVVIESDENINFPNDSASQQFFYLGHDMEIKDILKLHPNGIASDKVWKASRFDSDIEAFYEALLILVEQDNIVVEEREGKNVILKLQEGHAN